MKKFSGKTGVLAVLLFTVQISGYPSRLSDSLENRLRTSSIQARPLILNMLAQEIASSQPQKAGEYAREALDLSRKSRNRDEEANSLYSLGLSRFYGNDYPASLSYLNQCLKIARQAKNQKVISQVYSIIGYYYELKSDYTISLSYYRSALAIRETLGDKHGIAKSLDNIGNIYQQMSKYEDALKNYSRSLGIYMQINDARGLSEVNNNIGIIYFYLTNYPKAIQYFQRSLILKEALKDRKAMTTTLNNIAGIYEVMGDFPEALDYYRKTLKLQEEKGFKPGIAMASANIGTVFADMKKYPESLGYYKKALALFREKGNKSSIATTLANLGQVYVDMGRESDALSAYLEALSQQEKIGDLEEASATLRRIGDLYSGRGEYSKAAGYLERSLGISEKLNLGKEIMETSSSLAEVFHHLGQDHSAYEYIRKSNAIKDSLFNAEKHRQVNELQAKYESGQKDNEIRLLTKEKEIHSLNIARQRYFIYSLVLLLVIITMTGFLLYYRQRIRQQRQHEALLRRNKDIEERLLLSQMNPHFIFNVLNSIRTELQTGNADKASDLLIMFSRLMRTNLENSRQSHIPLADEIDSLRNYLELEKQRSEGKFDYIIDLSADIALETLFLPPLLIQPLLENAIKHGMRNRKEKGLISLRINKEANHLIILVEDNGIGREEAGKLQKEEDVQKRSLGSRLIRERMELFNVTSSEKFSMVTDDLYNEHKKSAGTKVVLRIPFETDS